MAKTSNFVKNRLKSILDESTCCTLLDFLDYWIFSNVWIPILFIIFLGVAFEIILVRTCEFFKKKLELWENGSSGSQKNEDGFPKGITFALESWSITHTSSTERIETFSGRVSTTSPYEENGDNNRERAFSSYDDCEFQESNFCESHSSLGGTNAPLSMFHSEVNKIFISQRKDPQSKYQAIQFSSSNLFSIMKTNSTKNSLPDDINFQSTFQFLRDKNLNVTPCPLVHLFLSGDQITEVEENIRRKIPVNPKAVLVRKADYLHHRFQEPFINNLHSNQIFIPAKTQDTFLDQNAIQNQMIQEACFTRQTQQFIYNQESVSSQHGFVQPLDFMRVPFSSSMQDSFQAQNIDHNDKRQHFINIPCIVEIQDSTKGKESEEHFSETQYSIYFNDPNKSNNLIKEQHSDFQNAEFLSLSTNSFANAVSQQNIMPEAQQLMTSLDSRQYYAHSSMSLSPTIKRQRRKIPDNERKLSLKVPSLKVKKTPCSRVFPIIVCHTSENKIELRCKKKKIVHQRKIMSDIALYLISKLISKLITPHVKKSFLKNLVMVIPDLINYEYFLQEQHKLPDTEKISYASSTDRVSLSITEDIEHSSMVNTNELKAPSSLFETNGERISEDSVQHTLDLNIPKHEELSEMLSESLQKDVSFPKIESHRRMKVQKDIQTTANVDELIVSTPNTKERIQNTKNSTEIILSFLGINLLISLGTQKHEKNELKDINIQVITGSIHLKEEKPLMNNITDYGKQTDSGKLECNTTSNKKNGHQYERMSSTSHNAMQATISEPVGMEIYSKLKAKSGTPVINYSHSALQEKLLDEKKIQEIKHIDESSIFRKPQECDRDNEEKNEEAVPTLAEDLRVTECLKQKVESVQFEMGQIHSENRTIQSKEKEVQSQTISTQTLWKTSSCPSTDPLQVEKLWQKTDKPTDREEGAGSTHPPSMPENLPTSEYLIETTECGIPFGRKCTKTLEGHITEDKEDWTKDLCTVATGPFKTRKKSSGTKNVLSVKHKIINVKKPAIFQRLCIRTYDTLIHRRKVGGSFERTMKQMLYNATLAPRLLNVHPQRSSIPNNKINIKITHPKPQVEKKENNLDSLTKENKAKDTLEVQSCHGVKVVEQALQERGTHNKRSFRCETQPVKEIKMEKEMLQAESFTDAIEKPVDSIRMDSFYVANIKNTSTQAELLNSEELKLGPPTSEKLLMGDSLNQARESNVPNNGNDTGEISCSFTQKVLLWLLSYCIPVLTRSKKKKDRTKFTNVSIVRLKYMNKVKPPASKTFNIRGNIKKSKLDLKAKFKNIKLAKAFLPECQNTICLAIHSILQGLFHHAQLKQELASKICAACIAESSAFYNREKQPPEENQNPFLQVLQHGQHLWADTDHRKKTLPDLSPSSVSQEQPANSQSIKTQKNSLQNTLKANLQMDPLDAEGLQKTTKTENGGNFPAVPKILFPKVGTSSPGEFTNTIDDLEFNKISESELDLYPAVNDSETSTNLQVTFLQSSDSVKRLFVSRPKGERKTPRSKKQTPVSQRRRTMSRTMSEIKLPQTFNFRYSKKLQYNKEIKDPQQRINIAAACLDVVPSKVHILPIKKIRSSKLWTEKQRIRRLGHLQLMQKKSPNGRNVHCSGSADASSFSSMKNYEDEGKEKPEDILISKNSSFLIFGMNQEKDHNLVRSDKQLNQLGRTITQVQPQTLTEAILCSATCPIPDEFQLDRLAACFSASPLKFGEAKDNALSERECDLFHEQQLNEHTGDSEKEEKELSVSHINPNHSWKIKYYSTKMKHTYQEKEFVDETPSSRNIVPDINMSSKIEKGLPSKKAPCFMQMKSEILCDKGKVTSDDIKEIDIQDKEKKQNDDDTLSMSLPQHSQHFVFYSIPSRDPNSHKVVKQRGRDILIIMEQDVTQQSQSAHKTRGEYEMYTSISKPQSIKSEESQIDAVKTVRTKYHSTADRTQAQELNSWDRLDRNELKNYLQATISESLNLSTPDIPSSKRQSKVFTYKALQGKMHSTGVTMKGRKAFVSKVLTIPQCGPRKNLLPKTLKSQISELLIHSGVLLDSLIIIILEDPTSEKNKRLTQKLAAIMLETLGLSTPTHKESKNLKVMDKGDEMNTNYLTVKASKAAISQTLITAGCRTPKPVAVSSLNAILSPMPVSLDVSTCNGLKDRDITWTTRSSRELHNQSVHEERSCHAHSTDKDATSNGTKDIKSQDEKENPLSSQHFNFSSQNMAGPNSVKSGLQLINSATCFELETTLYDGQAQLVNENNQQSIMGGVMLQLLNTEESEIGSIPCNNTWDGNPRTKCEYFIAEQKAWAQKNLRTLKPLQEPSLMSTEKKSENCTLEFPGKRMVSPTTKQDSRLLNIARQKTKVSRKKRYHNTKHQLRKMVHVKEALHHAIEDVEICPLKFITDELLFDTAERTAFYSRIPQRSMSEEKAKPQENLATTFLGPYNCFIPVLFDFKSQVNMIKLPENDSVLNQRFSPMKKRKLSVSKIIKINRYFITKYKKVKLSAKMKAIRLSENITDELQNTIHFMSTTSNRKNKFKAEVGLGISKFTQTQPTHGKSSVKDIIEYDGSVDKDGSNMQVSLENALSNVRKAHNWLEIGESDNNTTKLGKNKTGQSFLKEKSFYLTEIVTSIARNLMTSKEFKKQICSMRVPKLSAHKGIPSLKMKSTDSQSPHVEFETQDFTTPKIKVDNDEVKTDVKSVYPCIPIQHIKTELSHKIWDMYRKSAKGNCLDKAIVKRKEEFGQPILFKIASQKVQSFEADQKRQPDPFKPEIFSANMVLPKDIMLQKKAVYLTDQERNTKAGDEFSEEVVLSSNARSLHTEKQNNEFKTGWKTSSSFALLKKQKKHTSILGPMWRPYASYRTYLESIRRKEKVKISNVKSAMFAKQIKLKAKKIPLSLLLGHGGNKKKLMEVREGKGKPQKPYIPPQMSLKKMNKTRRLCVQPIDNNSISSTVRKSAQYTIKYKEHQVVLQDIIPQNKDPLMMGQQVKKLRHNFNSHLEQEAYRVVFPETVETDYSMLEVQRPREVADFEFSTAQSIKQGVPKDSIKHVLSIPPRRGGSKKTTISSSKEHDIFLMELDTFQKKTCKVQELLKQRTSRVGLGAVVCPVKESFDSENTKVPKKVGMYHSIKSISYLSLREGLRETDTELGPKAQPSLCTDLEDLHKTVKAQRDYTKSTQKPKISLNYVHCHKRAPFYLKPILSTTMKDSGVGPKRDLKGKEKVEPADSPLKLNRQKVDSSKKLRPKYLIIFLQNKEHILQFFLSCILYQLQTENTQKQISAKAALHSKLFKPLVEKTSSEVNILGDQSSSSEGVSLHTKQGKDWSENACKAFPMSNTQSLMDIHRITPPQVKKALKIVRNRDSHTLNTENGEQKRRIKELNQHHLSFSFKNLEEHIFDSPNYSYVQSHLEPQTKEVLSEVGNMPSRTKELDLSSKDQLSTVGECRPECISPSVISEQTKEEDEVLLLESGSKTIKCPSLLLSEKKHSSDRIQINKSVSNDSLPMLRVSKKELLSHKASNKKQAEFYLPEMFLHCLSLYMKYLHENEKLKGNIEYRAMKDIICLQRKAISLKRLELPPSRSIDYAQSNKAEPQCYKKEKMICMGHRKDKPGSVVIKACKPIPLPHLKLDKEQIDMIISSNVRQEKYKSHKEETGIKEMKMDGITGSNITLKTEESTLSYSSSGKKLTLCFNTKKQGKVQEKISKSDMKPTKSFISLPSLSHPNLNSRIKVRKDKSGLQKDCLPPLKPLPSLKSRKVPFSNPFNRDNVCGLIELDYLQQRKEYRNNISHLKDIIGLKHIARKGKKPSFKSLLHGKDLWWDNKIQKFIQGNKNNLDVVQNKPWDSVPSSLFLEWDPKTMEAYLKGITKFCLGSPAVLELSGAIGMYQELGDSVLSSIGKANHIPLKEIESKEVIHSSRLCLRQKPSSASQELQFNVEEKEKKIHEDKKIKNWNKPSLYSFSYSQVDTRVNGEEAIQIRTQSSSHCSKLQRPSDMGEIVYKKSAFEPVLNSVNHSSESVIHKEESTKTEKNIHLKENQSVSQKSQLNIKETEQELQIKDELNAAVTNTSKWTQTNVNENLGYLQERKCKLGESLALASLSHSKLDIEIKGKEKTWIKIGSCSLHSQNMKSSDAEKIYFAASSLNDIISDPERSKCLSYKEEDGVNTFERITMHPKAKHVNRKKSPLSYVPKIKRFKVDLEDQSKKKHESSREKVTLLRETCSAITSSDVFKLDISEEVETETMQSHVSYPVLQKSLPIGQVDSTKIIANNFKKRKLHPPWEEEVQTSATDNLTYLSGPISMTKISALPCMSSVKKHRTLSQKRTHQWNSNETTGQKQERARHHNVFATKHDASMSLLTTVQIACTKQISKCSIKSKILPLVQEEVQTPATDGSTYSNGLVLKAKVSAPTHVFNLSEHSTPRKRKTLHGKNKKRIRQKQEKARKFNVSVTKNDSSVPSRVNEEEDILGKIQFSLLPPKVKDVSDSDQKTCLKSSGYVLSNGKEPTQEEGKNRLRKDMKDEKIPKSIDQNVKKVPGSYALSIKELQSKTQGEKLLYLSSTTVKLSVSQLKLKKFSGSQIADRKVYSEIKLLKEHVPQKEKVGKKKHVGISSIIVHPKNIHLKTKRLPILPMQNLSDFQWKTRKQGGKVKEDRSESQISLTKKFTKISTATSPQPIFTVNAGIKEECSSMLTRPSVSMEYLQKSTDSEEDIQSITGNSSISLHSEKHVLEEKEEVGMQRAKLITHKYQQTKVQKLKDEQDLVLTKSSLLLDLPRPQLYEKTEFSNTKLRLRNPASQRILTEGETVPREVGITVGDTVKDVKKHHMPQREDTYRKEKIEIIDRRGTDVTLKSRKSLLSQKLHRTELHIHIKAPKPKKHDDNSKSRVLRKMYTSKASLISGMQCKSVQVVEVNHVLDGLESKSSPLPQIVPALSDTEKMTHKEDMCTNVKKGKQYSKQREKPIDLTIEVPCKKAKVSPISYLLNANKFVLNMKVLEKKVHKNKSQLTVGASRTFLSIPSADSIYSQDKTQKGTARFTKSPQPQENFREPADAQDTATRGLAEVDYKCIVKTTEHNVLLKQNRPQKSKCVTSALRISQHPCVKSEHKITFPHHKIDFTRLGTIIGEKVLDMSYKWQKGQQEKHKKEPSTKILNWKKESKIKDNLSHKAKFSVSPFFSLEKIPLKKLSIVHSSKSQDKEKQNVWTIEQDKPSAKGGQQVRPKSFPFLNVPVPSRNQLTPLQINVNKKPVVNISLQIQSGVHMSTKEFCDTKRKDPPLIVAAKKNLQGQQLFQTNNIKSLHAYIPICPKSQKNRFTVINLKRELKPKYSTIRIPKHPISKMLGIIGWGNPSRKRKLEYVFNKPKTMVPRSKDTASRIIIRSLCVSMINPPHNERIVESKTSLRREMRVCHSKFQEKLPDARKIKDILIQRNSFDTIETHLRRTMRINVSSPRLQSLSGTPLSEMMRECPLLSKHGEAAPGTVPTTFQDKNNENKTLLEHLFPIYKMLKSIFEIPVEKKIQNQALSEILEEVEAYKPGDTKASPLPESPDTSSKISATLLHTSLLKQLTPELKNKLTMHLLSKATEIKLNQIPEMVNTSLQKCDSHPQRTISEDNSYKFYLKHINMNFKYLKVDTLSANLKNNYERNFPPLSCVKTPTINVSSSNKKAMTEPKNIKKQESVTSLASLSNLPLIHVLYKFSEKEKDNLLVHLCTKTVEIQTTGLPRIAAQSYAIANGQDKSKPLFKCIHFDTKGPKQTNQVLVLFDEKSFCDIDCDLQHKYLRSLSNPSLTVVSTTNALPKHTSKISKGSGSECKKVDDNEESSTLSIDKEFLHVSSPKVNPQESSLSFRKLQEPINDPVFYPGLHGTEQNDIILSDLKLQVTPEKNKKCHAWLQKTSAYKHSVLETQQNTADLVNSHSSWISDDWMNVPLNTETSTDMVECQALEESNNEECVFIETNFYLTRDSQNFLSEVPKDIPLADIHIGDKATYLKPFSYENSNDSHTRTHRKPTSPVAQPFYQSQNSRKCRSNSKMQPSDWLSHSSTSTVEIESTSSSITFSEKKHWTKTTWSKTSYPLTSSTTESSIKLSLAKNHGKSHMYLQLKDRNNARSDLWRKSNIYRSSHYSHLLSKEKQTKKKRQTNQMPEPNVHWQNIKSYPERRENQPFLYVCVPADSMDVIPQTIPWVIPQKLLQKRNFHIPQVANISNS